MKSFKEYLIESKKVYEFKVKIAGDHPKDAVNQIEAALAEFHVASVSKGMTSPISERQEEFPEHRNTQMTVYEVTTDYPATGLQLRDRISSGLGVTHNHIKVRTAAEEREYAINHQYDNIKGEAKIGTAPEDNDASDLVSEKFKMTFLADLHKEKHQGVQVKGYNDQLLADSVPGFAPEYRKTKQATLEKTHASPIGTKQNKIPDPMKGAR